MCMTHMEHVHVYSSNFPLSLELNLGKYFQLIKKSSTGRVRRKAVKQAREKHIFTAKYLARSPASAKAGKEIPQQTLHSAGDYTNSLAGISSNYSLGHESPHSWAGNNCCFLPYPRDQAQCFLLSCRTASAQPHRRLQLQAQHSVVSKDAPDSSPLQSRGKLWDRQLTLSAPSLEKISH